MTRPGERVVVLSPHLDDAVLSCAGAIRRHVLRGDCVLVATIFSEGANGSRRRDEDRAAVASLGADVVHLGLLDAPERLGIPRSHRALVEEARVREEDVSLARAAIVDVVRDARIYAPLGVGEHVDHRVLHAAACDLPGVVFYEDRPYAFAAGAVRSRLIALGSGGNLGPPPDRAVVEAELETLPFHRAHLADDDRGVRARAWLTARLTAPAATLDRARPGASIASSRAETAVHGEEIARAATRAIRLYASQVDALFGGAELVAAAILAASRALGADASTPYAERTFCSG